MNDVLVLTIFVILGAVWMAAGTAAGHVCLIRVRGKRRHLIAILTFFVGPLAVLQAVVVKHMHRFFDGVGDE